MTSQNPPTRFEPETLKVLYSTAYEAYMHGQYEKAADGFRLLCTMDEREPKNWMGLGASFQMTSRPDDALFAYAMAVILDDENPWPHFHAGECYLDKKNTVEANQAFLKAKHLALKDIKKYQAIFNRIEVLTRTGVEP